jgi:ssRNA-specific RNase YbeY (16S rRNA maturation enzyme)
MELGKTVATVTNFCPNCQKEVDAATPMGTNREPRVGDLAICINCASLLIYTRKMNLRLPNDKEARELNADYRVNLAQTAVRLLIRERSRDH